MDSEIINQKLKILFVVNEIFPDGCGGVHTYIYEVAKGLVAKGHVVFILTKKVTDEAQDTEIIDGISVYRYKFRKYRIAFLAQVSCIINVYKGFKKLSEHYSFDLINFHSPHAAFGINLTKIAKSSPKVYTFHAPLYREEFITIHNRRYLWYQWRKYIKPFWLPIYLFLMKWLEKKGLQICEKIIALSDFISRCLIQTHRISADKTTKIPGGVDVEKFKPANDKNSVRKRLGLHLEKPILLTVRRLVPRMGLDNLIEAMPIVLKKCPSTVLLIGGEGPLRSELQHLIYKLKLRERVLLLGFIDNEKLPLYYQASDLFILPSRELEGFGMATLEALACGTPVLGTPVGGTVEILNKLGRGLLFKDTSSDSMADLIIEYLENDRKRTEIQNRCRQFILNNYSWEDATQQTEKLFLEISSEDTTYETK